MDLMGVIDGERKIRPGKSPYLSSLWRRETRIKLPCAVLCLYSCVVLKRSQFFLPQNNSKCISEFFYKLLIRENGHRLRTADV